MLLKIGHFGKQIRKTWKVLKCGTGEGRRRSSWTDRVRNEEVLHRIKEERNILHTVKRRKANRAGHMLRGNCLLKQVSEGNIEVKAEGMRRQG